MVESSLSTVVVEQPKVLVGPKRFTVGIKSMPARLGVAGGFKVRPRFARSTKWEPGGCWRGWPLLSRVFVCLRMRRAEKQVLERGKLPLLENES